MLHYRDNPVCVSPLALWSEAGLHDSGETAALACETIATSLLGGKRCPGRPLRSWRGG
jgi:hypothetical protein